MSICLCHPSSMAKAIDLLRQGRNEELWQMCCGFLTLDLDQFMGIQKRLLMEQIDLLFGSSLGKRILGGAKPDSVEEFRQTVPLTTYTAYCPELSEKREETLPGRPASWVHTSGRSGEYSCKWVPMTSRFVDELSPIMYGLGLVASCDCWGDTRLNKHPSVIYTVAPRPYMSGALADIVRDQTPLDYLPSIEEAEDLPFDERVRLGFEQALSRGLDCFFGLSLVLDGVGNKFAERARGLNVRPFLTQPAALYRLSRGMVRSKLERRRMLPRDLWKVKGIICSGLDSGVYRDNIKEMWGRYPLDIYANTEGGIIATQTWDFDSMTFIPNLNFLEFIPEEEHRKWQMDHRYQPRTILLDEVQAGKVYEIVITNFHGGSLVRYRAGDMVRIVSLRNENLGIEIPQMVFERRADDLLDFVVIRLTEKTIWQAIENSRVKYADWVAYKDPGEPVLNLLIEPRPDYSRGESETEMAVYEQLLKSDSDEYTGSGVHDDLANMIKFRLKVKFLPRGAFAAFMQQRQSEGADLAHLKPPHINPPANVLAMLQSVSQPAAGPVDATPRPESLPVG
jgi:hypothetical protein